jgi:GntR family transcriptional regulator of arabinose operon
MDIERIKGLVQQPTPAPLHQKLRDAIQEQIEDQTLAPGTALPSERSLKDNLGVSRATVRQAINALIQDGFLQSVAGTGNFVLEPSVQTHRAGVVGLITSSPNFNFFYPQLTAAFNERIRRAGLGLTMTLHDESADLLDTLVTEMMNQDVVALAITPPRYGDMTETLARLRRHRVPVVLIGRSVPKAHADVVATDNRDIGYRATRYLLEMGHQHIAYVGLLGYSTGDLRAAGYRQALDEAGYPPHIYHLAESTMRAQASGLPSEHLADPAHAAIHQIWSVQSDLIQPTAIFCFNDIVAMGAYKALRDLNLAIPQDVSLISVDNLIAVRHFEVPLTTFALPGEAIGTRSAEILLRRLDGETAQAETVLLPASLHERASVSRLTG